MEMKLEITGKEVIKPSSPTPDHLRHVSLSLVDQYMPETYIDAMFFFHIPSEKQSIQEAMTFSQRLKSSLSEALTRFYPLAGQIESGLSVNCNDKGALFTEARTEVLLSEFLKNPNFYSLKQLQVDPVESWDPAVWPLLHVKVSFFKGGDVAVSISISHKIFDADSSIMFIRCWADYTAGRYGEEASPAFISSILYPPADSSLNVPALLQLGNKSTTKRFVFNSSKIKELKLRTASENIVNPTRVEATTALIVKAIKASRSNRPFAMSQPINVRSRIPPSLLPRNQPTVGNLIYIPLIVEGPEKEMNTAAQLRNAKEELSEMIQDPNGTGTMPEVGERIVSQMMSYLLKLVPEMDKYLISSFCRMPYYEVDFGWGTPVWVAHNLHHASRVCLLVDAKGGEGIEAWVTLPEQEMSAFEHDQDLIAFATSNPSVPIMDHCTSI